MQVDTRGLHERHIGKDLRIELVNGEVEKVHLWELTVCEKPEPCCGITYTLLSTTNSGGAKKEGSVYWVGFGDIKRFEVLGEPLQ